MSWWITTKISMPSPVKVIDFLVATSLSNQVLQHDWWVWKMAPFVWASSWSWLTLLIIRSKMINQKWRNLLSILINSTMWLINLFSINWTSPLIDNRRWFHHFWWCHQSPKNHDVTINHNQFVWMVCWGLLSILINWAEQLIEN